jgi:hypothetical protein
MAMKDQMKTNDIWLTIYKEIHEHIRDTLKRRDQIIAFYLVLLAALIGAWDKLKEIQNVAVAGVWIVGIACFFVITQYWRWQIILHLSMVTIQSLMTSKKQLSISECKRIWNEVNDINTTIWALMKPSRGVEITIIYLFAFLTFVPGYLLLQISGVAILRINSEAVAFLLDAIVYTAVLALLSSWFVKSFLKFNERDWMFRWLRAFPNGDEE